MQESFPVPLTGTPINQAITYQLHIVVKEPLALAVGRLGHYRLDSGRYVYTGSARRNMTARLRRHLALEKTRHWHIDYLLSGTGVRIVGIHLSHLEECKLNQAVEGVVPVPGFGASDCRQGCGSHLKYLGLL